MSKELVYSFAAHLLNRQDYSEEVIESYEPWLELSQDSHEILLYQIPKDFKSDFSKKCKFVEEVEYTYQFIHPAIAKTFKYTYSDNLSISYLGNKNSLFAHEFKNGKLSNTIKQIVLIGIASAMIYLQNKGVSHYCLDVNHIILDEMQFPKLVCSGIPSAFKSENWDDEISELQSFGKFAQTILSDQNKIPAAIQDIIDKCINIQSNEDNDIPTFNEILNILSNKKNYLSKVEDSTISKYIMWLDFQDKFPCDYFFELDKKQSKSLFEAIHDHKTSSEFSSILYHAKKGYPRDIFGALYFYNQNESNDSIDIPQTFWMYYGCPQWIKNLYKNNESTFNSIDKREVMFNPNNSFHIKDQNNRRKFNQQKKKMFNL